MKTRLELAHDYLRDIISNWDFDDNFDPVAQAYEYADAMLAENEKREQDKRTLAKDENGNCMHFHTTFGRGECFDCGAKLKEEWRPDWSVAPDGYDWFAVDEWGSWWYRNEPKWDGNEWTDYQDNLVGSESEQADLFNYQGDWQDSLRKRPRGK